MRLAQPAALKFSAFNQRTTPEIDGEVAMVSADVSQDQKTGAFFNTVRIAIPDDQAARLGGLKLKAGMPVEFFIRTGMRLVVSYLTRSIADQVARAFREQ